MMHTQQNLGISLALAGTLMAAKKNSCKSCDLPEPPFVDRTTMIYAGLLGYSAALYGSLAQAEWVPTGMQWAATLHIALLLYSFLYLKKVCPICMITASGALIAASA